MENEKKIGQFTPGQINDYYNQFTDSYLETYGDVIQAFRPSNTAKLHDYIIDNADLKDGQVILDAGCGVGGPACYFATKLDVEIHGITISETQVAKASTNAEKLNLQRQTNFVLGDFHELTNHFEGKKFDRILFLESLGHAADSAKVLREAKNLLKTGGSIYIKDFFPFEILDKELKAKHEIVIQNINKAYCYNVLELHHTISAARELGLEITFIKKFSFQDDITARAAFEEQNKVDLFGEMEEFRVAEWLELKFTLPEWPLF